MYFLVRENISVTQFTSSLLPASLLLEEGMGGGGGRAVIHLVPLSLTVSLPINTDGEIYFHWEACIFSSYFPNV